MSNGDLKEVGRLF